MPNPSPACLDCGNPNKLPGRNRCRRCHNDRSNRRRAERADEINAKKRERYAIDSEYRERIKASVRAYQQGSGYEARRAYEASRMGAPGRTWREWADNNGNRERKRNQERERYWSDPEFRARKILNALVRSRREAKGDLTVEQWISIVNQYGGFCAYCEAPYGHMDHVIPLSRGGHHTASNVLPACSDCNLEKGNKTPEEWGCVPRRLDR